MPAMEKQLLMKPHRVVVTINKKKTFVIKIIKLQALRFFEPVVRAVISSLRM